MQHADLSSPIRIELKLPALEGRVATIDCQGSPRNLIFISFLIRCSSVAALAFFSHGEQGLLLVAVPGLLIAVASLFAEHRLLGHGLQ